MRIAYLGPAGTFTEDALKEALPEGEFEGLRTATIPDAILAVERGEADRALVPIENSIEGSVRPTLDTLAFEASAVTIVGEHDYRVRVHLIAREGVAVEDVEAVLSHPQPLAQCARFLRERLPGIELRSASSTAAAVRMVERVDAAVGGSGGAGGGRALRLRAAAAKGSRTPTTTSPASSGSPRRGPSSKAPGPGRPHSSSPSSGADHPGALVDALSEFSSRGINLTRIESRPLRQGLGRYMFFCDLEGKEDDEIVAEAIAQLRTKADSVRILGSYPLG